MKRKHGDVGIHRSRFKSKIKTNCILLKFVKFLFGRRLFLFIPQSLSIKRSESKVSIESDIVSSRSKSVVARDFISRKYTKVGAEDFIIGQVSRKCDQKLYKISDVGTGIQWEDGMNTQLTADVAKPEEKRKFAGKEITKINIYI